MREILLDTRGDGFPVSELREGDVLVFHGSISKRQLITGVSGNQATFLEQRTSLTARGSYFEKVPAIPRAGIPTGHIGSQEYNSELERLRQAGFKEEDFVD